MRPFHLTAEKKPVLRLAKFKVWMHLLLYRQSRPITIRGNRLTIWLISNRSCSIWSPTEARIVDLESWRRRKLWISDADQQYLFETYLLEIHGPRRRQSEFFRVACKAGTDRIRISTQQSKRYLNIRVGERRFEQRFPDAHELQTACRQTQEESVQGDQQSPHSKLENDI